MREFLWDTAAGMGEDWVRLRVFWDFTRGRHLNCLKLSQSGNLERLPVELFQSTERAEDGGQKIHLFAIVRKIRQLYLDEVDRSTWSISVRGFGL
jgi:hypothetical protein